jgi:hypothetical protein
MGTIDILVLIIVFIEHVLNNLTQKKAWKPWKHWLFSLDYCIYTACAEQPYTKEGLKTMKTVKRI